jgi:hypothetical protein
LRSSRCRPVTLTECCGFQADMDTAPTSGKAVTLVHSPALDSVWRTAAREAAASFYRYVEREHLLIALFALPKAAESCLDSDAQSLRSEARELRCLYELVGTEPEDAAELLRKRIGTHGYKHTVKIVHRSGTCRSIFNCADQLARGRGETTVRCIHLLAAILEDPGEHFLGLVKDPVAGLDALRRDVTRSVSKLDQVPPVTTAPIPAGETGHIVLLMGKQSTDKWRLRQDRPLLIGRSGNGEGSVDIDLWPDLRTSRAHARLWFSEGRWWIEDLNSALGTLVGDRQIKGNGAFSLDYWNKVRIGDTILMLVPPYWHRVQIQDLILDLEAGPAVNLGVFQCSGAVVKRLMATNRGSTRSAPQAVHFSLSEYAASEEVRLPALTHAQTVELDIPKFRFDYGALESRVEKSLCLLTVKLGEGILNAPPIEIWILPANEWACGRACEHQLSLASFVMPNHPSVQELARGACVHLPAEHNAEESLRAIYDYLLACWELSYMFEPPAWRSSGLKIRFPHQVLSNSLERQGQGTCIDLALLVAAGLEYLHHDPLISVVDMGDTWHSLVGCWRNQKDGLEPLLYEKERILTEAVWVDPNGCTRPPEYGWEFAKACREADAVLAGNPLVFALDVAPARKICKVEPLPFSGQPELSKEVRAAIAKASEIGHSLRQPVGTVHILLGLLSVDHGITQEILREIGIPTAQAIERLTAGLSNIRGRDEDGLTLTRHHDMVLSVARSFAKRAGLHVVQERFAIEALLSTPSSAMDNALRNLGTSREALYGHLSRMSTEFKTYPTVPSVFPD